MMQIKCKKLQIFTNLHSQFTAFSTCLAVKGQDETSGYMLVSTSYDSGTSSEKNILVFDLFSNHVRCSSLGLR